MMLVQEGGLPILMSFGFVFFFISEFLGLYVFPVGGFAPELRGLGQAHTQLETAKPAPAWAPHT